MDIGSIWTVWIIGSLEMGLVELFGLLGSWGLAIVVFTIAMRLILFPLTWKQLQSSKAMQELQPRLSELQKKHKGDREKLMQEQMKLYKEHGVNPMAGCLPMLVQMPIWFGLYQALIALAARPDFHQAFLWLPSLAVPDPIYLLAILTGVTQWVVQRMMTPQTQDPQQKSMNMAMQFMPIMFAFFAIQVPAGLALYWVASNLFSLVQQYFVTGWGALLPQKAGAQAVVGGSPRITAPAVSPATNGDAGQDAEGDDAASGRASSRRRRSRRR